MKFSTISAGLLACASPLVSATALTYKLQANEKACFFSNVEQQGAKVAFYFAVCSNLFFALRSGDFKPGVENRGIGNRMRVD